MPMRFLFSVILGPLSLVAPSVADPCPARIGSVPTPIGGAVAFRTDGLAVDADGAPNSYLVDGNGLSRTCDGVVAIVAGRKVEPGQPDWLPLCEKAWEHARASGDYAQVSVFGFHVDPVTNVPTVQGPSDPLPGTAFVSTTSLAVPGAPETSQRHWVDATTIPYVVLTKSFARTHAMALGDVAAVYVPSSGKLAYAVFADEGPALGEASVRLHAAIGYDPIVRRGGIERASAGLDEPVVTVAFPGKRTHPTADAAAWSREIIEVGGASFEAWGGLDRLKSCSP